MRQATGEGNSVDRDSHLLKPVPLQPAQQAGDDIGHRLFPMLGAVSTGILPVLPFPATAIRISQLPT
jgi:hypothetical protein